MHTELHGSNYGQCVVTPCATLAPVTPGRLDLKADALLKHNIDELLRARGQRRVELSRYCRMSRSWLDKIFSEGRREIPLKHLDRIADFFGIATYQLLQPGISPLTERRSRTDRRSGRDRRLSQQVLAERQSDVDLMQVVRLIDRRDVPEAINVLMGFVNKQLRSLRTKASGVDAPDHTGENAPATHAPARARKDRR